LKSLNANELCKWCLKETSDLPTQFKKRGVLGAAYSYFIRKHVTNGLGGKENICQYNTNCFSR
jgi:hypothetical protein